MIKSYRGLLVDGGQDTIPLHTTDGKTGYRITKFQIINSEPGDFHMEHTVKIYKTEQLTVDNTVNFSDNSLLAAAFLVGNANEYSTGEFIIFDKEIFNQDIYVTHMDTTGANLCNYYIELEQIKLSEVEALVAIVKDLREEQ
jgi:hypothetical protein